MTNEIPDFTWKSTVLVILFDRFQKVGNEMTNITQISTFRASSLVKQVPVEVIMKMTNGRPPLVI